MQSEHLLATDFQFSETFGKSFLYGEFLNLWLSSPSYKLDICFSDSLVICHDIWLRLCQLGTPTCNLKKVKWGRRQIGCGTSPATRSIGIPSAQEQQWPGPSCGTPPSLSAAPHATLHAEAEVLGSPLNQCSKGTGYAFWMHSLQVWLPGPPGNSVSWPTAFNKLLLYFH